jgi:glycosyltransferase involved in cell wall biosynthesis
MVYRFHILAVPHAVSTPEYSTCAFTQKVLKISRMLKHQGHTVIHYGHEYSHVECDEHVSVTTDTDLHASYGDHDWRSQGFPRFSPNDAVYKSFYANATDAIAIRKRRGDFLLCTFGAHHKRIADAHPDMIICEPGIGYPGGGFAPFRVFESYSIMHAYLGLSSVATMNDKLWYNVVIPNAFDPAEFVFSKEKDDYFFFLGRINLGKGIHVALQIIEEIGGRLIFAGPGGLRGKLTRTDRPITEYAEYVGVIGPSERGRLMSRAKGLLAPSMFLEPFCGVQIEAMLSGTPVISSDWGAFTEYNLHGITGYRCRTFEQFTWAARNIHTIDPHACRTWAERNFSLERVGEMYDEYFFSVNNIFSGKGWYEDNKKRVGLDWLTKFPPTFPH